MCLKRDVELTDVEMKLIARKMADDYLNQLYWDSLREITEEILTRREESPTCISWKLYMMGIRLNLLTGRTLL